MYKRYDHLTLGMSAYAVQLLNVMIRVLFTVASKDRLFH